MNKAIHKLQAPNSKIEMVRDTLDQAIDYVRSKCGTVVIEGSAGEHRSYWKDGSIVACSRHYRGRHYISFANDGESMVKRKEAE